MKRIFIFTVFVFLSIATSYASWIPSHPLTSLSNWVSHRNNPDLLIRFSNVSIKDIQTLHIDEINISSKDGKEPFAVIKDVTITATPIELIQHHIQNLSAGEIDIRLSENSTAKPNSSQPANDTQAVWKFDRVTCGYGMLDIKEESRSLHFKTKFSLDLKDFGTDDVFAKNLQKITLWSSELSVDANAPILQLDFAEASFSVAQLKSRHLSVLSISGGDLAIGDSLRNVTNQKSDTTNAGKDDASWIIDQLSVEDVDAKLSDLDNSVPDIQFTIKTTLYNLSASKATEEVSTAMQQVEISDLNIYSPLDPFVKIVSLRSIFVRFSLQQLLKKKIADITILGPTIYINQDLFWYMDRQQKKQDAQAVATDDSNSWTITNLSAAFGKLVLAFNGKREVGLPWYFNIHARKVSFANLLSLHLKTDLTVPMQSFPLPDYQLSLNNLQGDIRLAYPNHSRNNNLVSGIKMEQIQWRQYLSKNLWLSVTFDSAGINGNFGGKAYGGKVGGGFSFFFANKSPWMGWVYGDGIDSRALTDIMAPQNIRLTGKLDFDMQVDAEKKEIRRLKGRFKMRDSGHIKISKLDNMLKDIPGTWSPLKQSSMRVALEGLRDFDYTQGKGDFWFVDSQGILKINFTGDYGSRNLDVVLHNGDFSSGRWQQKPIKTP
ncbi:MAG: hypothetical protein ABI443_06455 [Chthoniobacterales bacterium]